MIAIFSRLRLLIFAAILALGYSAAWAQYSVGQYCFHEAYEEPQIDKYPAIISPIGVVCDTELYGTVGNVKRTAVHRGALIAHIGNASEKNRADILALKAEMEALRIDYLKVKEENDKWRAATLAAAMDRIEMMPGEFAALKSVRDVLTPLVIEAIRNNPSLLATLKSP
jgi:hypothetical protein